MIANVTWSQRSHEPPPPAPPAARPLGLVAQQVRIAQHILKHYRKPKLLYPDLTYEALGFDVRRGSTISRRFDAPTYADHELVGLEKRGDWHRVPEAERISALGRYREQTDFRSGANRRESNREPDDGRGRTVMSLAAQIKEGTHLVAFDIDVHPESGRIKKKDEIVYQFMVGKAVRLLVQALAGGDLTGPIYVEQRTFGQGAHVFAMLTFDPSQKSAVQLAYRVSREVGLDIDAFTAQGGGLIALPFSARYSHAGIVVDASEDEIWNDDSAIEAGYTAGPILFRPKDRVLPCVRDADDVLAIFAAMREHPAPATGVLRPADEERFLAPIARTRLAGGKAAQAPSLPREGDDFGSGERQGRTFQIAYDVLRQGGIYEDFEARMLAGDSGSKDIRRWRKAGSLETILRKQFSWAQDHFVINPSAVTETVSTENVAYDIEYDRELGDDEDRLFDLMFDTIEPSPGSLGDRSREDERTFAREILALAISYRDVVKRQRGYRYLGELEFLNQGEAVPLGRDLLERIRKRLCITRVCSRNAVFFLIRSGLLSEPLRHPRTGREYSFNGSARFCKHHVAYRPSEALSLRVPLVVMYETTGGVVSFSLPTGDELGCPPRIAKVTVLDNLIPAARLAALPDQTIIDLIGGKTPKALAFSLRARHRGVEGPVALTEQSVRLETATRDLDALRTPIEISGSSACQVFPSSSLSFPVGSLPGIPKHRDNAAEFAPSSERRVAPFCRRWRGRAPPAKHFAAIR
ncbi:MAG: hypothetical protein ACLQMF_05480 [Rectinemataceae bacterium]